MHSTRIVAALSLLPLAALAQQPTPTRPDTAYYNSNAQKLPGRVGATRVIVTERQEGGRGVVQTILTPKGVRLERIPYADQNATEREGVALAWFEGGALKWRKPYRNGLVHGQMLLYYPDGTLHELLQYQKGEQQSRQCFEPSGQDTKCPPEVADVSKVNKVYARYGAGPLRMNTELYNRLRYPTLPPDVEPYSAQVVIACMIGVDGRMRETRVYKSVRPEFDAEALRAVQTLQGSWIPQLVDGEPEESFLTLEVNFYPKVRR